MRMAKAAKWQRINRWVFLEGRKKIGEFLCLITNDEAKRTSDRIHNVL